MQVSAYGEYISYADDTGEKHCVNASGEELPEGAVLGWDGSYVIEKDGVGKVYDTNGKELFEYTTTEMKVKNNSPYHYSMREIKTAMHFIGVTGTSKYVILNRSAEFESTPQVCGKYIYLGVGDEKIYDFDGNVIVDEPIKSVKYDSFTKAALELKKTDGTVLITNVFSRNSEVSLFHNSKYFAVMETISQNSFRRQRCNEVPGICVANSYAKHGFDSGKHQKCFPTRHDHYNHCRGNGKVPF